MRRILALDPATTTGWAFWSIGRELPDYGVRLFKKRPLDHPGQRFAEYERFLREVFEHHQPDIVYYEAPLFPGRRTARGNLTVSFGFEAILQRVASEWTVVAGNVEPQRGIPCIDVHPATLKKWSTGNGKAEKEDMIAAAMRLTGVTLTENQDNEADALCLVVYGANQEGVETP